MTKNNGFKGKFYYYSNINGQEKKVEKEFDDQKEFNSFVKDNPEVQMPVFNWSRPPWGFGNMLGLNSYVDQMFDKKFDDYFSLPGMQPTAIEGVDVDMTKYEHEAQKIREQEYEAQMEKEKELREKKKANLERALEKLGDYKALFQENDNKAKLKEVETDIAKVKKQINELKE